jgi:hypothetical protein
MLTEGAEFELSSMFEQKHAKRSEVKGVPVKLNRDAAPERQAQRVQKRLEARA